MVFNDMRYGNYRYKSVKPWLSAVAETQLKIRAAVPAFTPFQAYSDIKQKTAPRGAVSLCIIYALF